MSMWQYAVAVEGWVKANTTSDEDKPSGSSLSDSQADEIWKWMQEKQDVPLTAMRH